MSGSTTGTAGILVVNRVNSYGLVQDYEILADVLHDADVKFELAKSHHRRLLDRLFGGKEAECLLFLERIYPAWANASTRRWVVPNQERFPKRHLGFLKKNDVVFAKTRHAAEIFQREGAQTDLIGFTSKDRRRPGAARDWSRFLHVAGANTLKGTETILTLWAAHPEWPELTLIQKAANAPKQVPANVKLLSGYLSDEQLADLQNICGVHLCPSRSEGWGHYILEAMSVGAVVVTTDAPPMNEHITTESGILVGYSRTEPRHLGTNFFVDPVALERAITRAIDITEAEKVALGEAARSRYVEIDRGFRSAATAAFRKRFAELGRT